MHVIGSVYVSSTKRCILLPIGNAIRAAGWRKLGGFGWSFSQRPAVGGMCIPMLKTILLSGEPLTPALLPACRRKISP